MKKKKKKQFVKTRPVYDYKCAKGGGMSFEWVADWQGSDDGKGWYARIREIQKEINTKKDAPTEKPKTKRRPKPPENTL